MITQVAIGIIHFRAVKKDMSLEDNDLDKTLTEVARLFAISHSSIGYSVQRGETIAEENNYHLIYGIYF